jgi:hypothetical protein
MTSLSSEALPSRLDAASFAARAFGLRLARGLKEALSSSRVARHGRSDLLKDAPIVAEIASPLWTVAGGVKEFALTAGKVENLRLAVRHIDGVELPPGETFSFWKQCGPPWGWRGFVLGRELREGCMIPTSGGGLCQLSNALYQAALSAGFEIVERHAHTRRVPGSRAAVGEDATVFWNYVDLRFRSCHRLRVEARLTRDHLVVALRAADPVAPASRPAMPDAFAPPDDRVGDCVTCGQTACWRNEADVAARAFASTAWLLDAYTPELSKYYSTFARLSDAAITPTRLFARSRYAWPRRVCGRESSAEIAALRRSLDARGAGENGALQARALKADARLAAAYARRLSPTDANLVVAQNLLPHLWRLGALGGRGFRVAMTRLPMQDLHAVLDAAARKYPESSTLADFRAPDEIVSAEAQALSAASELLTSHTEIAARFPDKTTLLPWAPVTPMASRRGGRSVLLPASALARKGAFALREAIQGLDLELFIAGAASESDDFWQGMRTRKLDGKAPPAELAAVVLPAIVEHQPRRLLAALAAGIPVIATPACGLPPQPGLTLVPAMDAGALAAALTATLEGNVLRRQL